MSQHAKTCEGVNIKFKETKRLKRDEEILPSVILLDLLKICESLSTFVYLLWDCSEAGSYI